MLMKIRLRLSGLYHCFARFSHLALAALGDCISKSPSVCNAFLLCLTSFYYLNEWSDTKLVNTIFVKTAEPHQAALKINSDVVWLRSKWGLKLTYFLYVCCHAF